MGVSTVLLLISLATQEYLQHISTEKEGNLWVIKIPQYPGNNNDNPNSSFQTI
jgi:hypothetical protein